MKLIKFTDKYLEEFFDDNFIEDDNLYEFLKGREGTIEEDTETKVEGLKKDDSCFLLNIKIRLKDL